MEFVTGEGQTPFSAWLRGQGEDVQAEIDTRILVMRGMPMWPPKWVRAYKTYDKLLELRIPFKRVQYRPLGCYGPARREFTLLSGAIEKDGKIPKAILQSAMDRMKLALEDRRWVREYQFDTSESLEETSE